MKHVVSYARYSSDNQREESIEDQQRKCDQFAEHENLTVTRKYADKAITGKADDRPEYQRLISDIQNGEIEMVIVDDLSRLSRSVTAASVIEEFKYLGVRLIAVADGIDSYTKSSKLLIGVKAAMNSAFLDDMKQRVHRGLEGNALKGYTTGGRIYGYRPKAHYSATEKDVYGRPLVEYATYAVYEDEARWVRTIFQWAAEGKSYAGIARELNRLGVPSPTGRGWTSSSITSSVHGQPTGILNNKLYIGVKIWNKTETVYHPTTGKGKKISRDESEWITVEHPELRIVSDAIWEAVKTRQEKQKRKTRAKQATTHPNARTGRNPKYLFSGVLKCGHCGANLIMVDKNNYRCGDAHRRGEAVCGNKQKIARIEIEQRLLASIQNDLFRPEAIQAFREEAEKSLKERKADLEPNIRKLNAELKRIDGDAEGLITFIQNQPIASQSELIAKQLHQLEQEKRDVESRLKAENAMITNISPILPRAVDRFRELAANLPDSLSGNIEHLRGQVVGLLGEEVIMTPVNDKGWEATYRGNYRGLLRLGGSSQFKINDDALNPAFLLCRSLACSRLT
ncbi:MAG: recombinase family protein [Candidatus Thiodiazotropha endolucinida]